MRKLFVFALILIAYNVSAQVDVMKFLVAKQVQESAISDITIVNSRQYETFAEELLSVYEKGGADAIEKVMDEMSPITNEVGVDMIAMKNQFELIDTLANDEGQTFKKYDDIKKASIAVRQATDGTYIVLITSYL